MKRFCVVVDERWHVRPEWQQSPVEVWNRTKKTYRKVFRTEKRARKWQRKHSHGHGRAFLYEAQYRIHVTEEVNR